MPITRERYGIPATEVNNLRDRWRTNISKDCTWKDFDDFLLWCSENGYQKRFHLQKNIENEPHGPGNSFFSGMYAKDREKTKAKEPPQKPAPEVYEPLNKLENVVSPYCIGCERTCPGQGNGCVGWAEYYIKNWNQNIYRPQPEERPRQTWKHEHPDLEREGLRFENRQT